MVGEGPHPAVSPYVRTRGAARQLATCAAGLPPNLTHHPLCCRRRRRRHRRALAQVHRHAEEVLSLFSENASSPPRRRRRTRRSAERWPRFRTAPPRMWWRRGCPLPRPRAPPRPARRRPGLLPRVREGGTWICVVGGWVGEWGAARSCWELPLRRALAVGGRSAGVKTCLEPSTWNCSCASRRPALAGPHQGAHSIHRYL